MQAATLNAHIAFKATTGEPIIKDTNVSVRAVAELWRDGAQPEEIRLHIPHLTLAQIFAALEYYHDHKDEIEGFIARNAVPEGLSGTRLP